jgi:hypothetical protein
MSQAVQQSDPFLDEIFSFSAPPPPPPPPTPEAIPSYLFAPASYELDTRPSTASQGSVISAMTTNQQFQLPGLALQEPTVGHEVKRYLQSGSRALAWIINGYFTLLRFLFRSWWFLFKLNLALAAMWFAFSALKSA